MSPTPTVKDMEKQVAFTEKQFARAETALRDYLPLVGAILYHWFLFWLTDLKLILQLGDGLVALLLLIRLIDSMINGCLCCGCKITIDCVGCWNISQYFLSGLFIPFSVFLFVSGSHDCWFGIALMLQLSIIIGLPVHCRAKLDKL